VSWFQRPAPSRAGVPSAWRFGGPTSDNTSGSSSLTAAATRAVTGRRVTREREQGHEDWQAEAWAMYDQVGELRYVANAIAGRMGSAELYVERDGERVDDSEDDDPILALITSQMVERLGLNLFVGGDCTLAGLPAEGAQAPEPGEHEEPTSISPTGGAGETRWLVLSPLEVSRKAGATGKVLIRGEEYDEERVYLERVWDPHPAAWAEADSPVRAALPVLRELVGLTQHVSAQIDSRLAGAGVYWIPNEILNSAKVPEAEAQATFAENPVLNAIMAAMLLPMEDRANAAAVVPLLLGAPGDAISKIRFDSFSTPFDENTKELREETIRRLALNLDAPPELLLGMGGSNHWAAWLVRDEVVQIHVAPRLDLVCDALTTGFYRPVLRQLRPGEDPLRYRVRADVSGLVQRPNRLADASSLHAVNALSDRALREAGGFEESDAPTSEERAVAVALAVAQGNPQLLDNMPEIVSAVKALLDGTPESGPAEVESAREPGTLVPLAPGNRGVAPTRVRVAPNGQPAAPGAAPVSDADAPPAARPV
jgi:hypothetical protein